MLPAQQKNTPKFHHLCSPQMLIVLNALCCRLPMLNQSHSYSNFLAVCTEPSLHLPPIRVMYGFWLPCDRPGACPLTMVQLSRDDLDAKFPPGSHQPLVATILAAKILKSPPGYQNRHSSDYCEHSTLHCTLAPAKPRAFFNYRKHDATNN